MIGFDPYDGDFASTPWSRLRSWAKLKLIWLEFYLTPYKKLAFYLSLLIGTGLSLSWNIWPVAFCLFAYGAYHFAKYAWSYKLASYTVDEPVPVPEIHGEINGRKVIKRGNQLFAEDPAYGWIDISRQLSDPDKKVPMPAEPGLFMAQQFLDEVSQGGFATLDKMVSGLVPLLVSGQVEITDGKSWEFKNRVAELYAGWPATLDGKTVGPGRLPSELIADYQYILDPMNAVNEETLLKKAKRISYVYNQMLASGHGERFKVQLRDSVFASL